MATETNRDFKANKEREYRLYLIWKSLPKGFTKESYEALSITDEVILELSKITTQKELAKHLGVRPTTIADWNKHPIPHEYRELDWRYWARQVTPTIVAKYVKETVENADAPRFTAWMKYVEQVEEKSRQALTDANGKDIVEGLAGLIAGADKVLKEHGESI
jgi:hypothetical protein